MYVKTIVIEMTCCLSIYGKSHLQVYKHDIVVCEKLLVQSCGILCLYSLFCLNTATAVGHRTKSSDCCVGRDRLWKNDTSAAIHPGWSHRARRCVTLPHRMHATASHQCHLGVCTSATELLLCHLTFFMSCVLCRNSIISVLQVAERVATERCERCGENSVGFQIRLEKLVFADASCGIFCLNFLGCIILTVTVCCLKQAAKPTWIDTILYDGNPAPMAGWKLVRKPLCQLQNTRSLSVMLVLCVDRGLLRVCWSRCLLGILTGLYKERHTSF